MFEAGKGPIPGENFTSDTRNYPWHQPPQFTDIDEALDMMGEKISKKAVANSLLTVIELGVPLYRVTSMLITAGIMNGKWTVDFALLIAGPITRMLELLCIGYGVEYEVGVDEDESYMTGAFFKEIANNRPIDGMKILQKSMDSVKEDAKEAEPKAEPDMGSMGFMAQQTGGVE